MTIDFTGATTGLFPRLAKIANIHCALNQAIGGSDSGDLPALVNGALTIFDGETNDIRQSIANILPEFESFQAAYAQALRSELVTAFQTTLIETVDEDNPLTNKTVEEALRELIRQMQANNREVDANEPAITVTADGGNEGNGTIVTSLLEGDGVTKIENAYAEDVTVTVLTNSETKGEKLRIEGEQRKTNDRSHYNWPGGSGIRKDTYIWNPSVKNKVSNGTFESFSGDDPTGWVLTSAGTGGTDYEIASESYRLDNSFKFIGDGSSLRQISQSISAASLTKLRPYILSFRMKRGASAISSGVFAADLYDGSAVIQDDNAANNSLSVTCSTLTTSWSHHTAIFRLPDPRPSTVQLRLRFSTALENTREVLIDDVLFEPMEQLYDGGPWFAMVKGSDVAAGSDRWNLAIANDYRSNWQTTFWRFCGLPAIPLPSVTDGSEDVSESLITGSMSI